MSYGKGICCLHCGYEENIKFTGDVTCGIYLLYLDEKTGKYRNVMRKSFSLVEKELDKYYERQMVEVSYERLFIRVKE